MLEPILDDISKDPKYNIFELNIDHNSIVSNEYSVSSIPTLIVFKDGVEMARIVGYVEKDVIVDALDKHM
ncbi:Thioredoxin [compost metagenome]